MNNLPTLSLGIHSVPYPVVQGGMGIRNFRRTVWPQAVANAGGIGIISAVGLGWNSSYFDPTERSPPKRRTEQFFEGKSVGADR